MDKLRKIVIEVVGQHSSMGKSLMSDMCYIATKSAGMATSLVRIESKREQRARWSDESLIEAESFKHTAETAGGAVGILSAAFNAIENVQNSGGAVIIDWGAGLSEHRYEAFAAAATGHILPETGVETYSFIVTTNSIDHMQQAFTLIKTTRQLFPTGQILLVVNEIGGVFDFAAGSDSKLTYDRLVMLVDPECRVRMPKIGAAALNTLAALGRPLSELITLESSEIAKRLGLNSFVAIACQSHLQAFLSEVDEQLTKVFDFRTENKPVSAAPN
jgi:hypothetical protein